MGHNEILSDDVEIPSLQTNCLSDIESTFDFFFVSRVIVLVDTALSLTWTYPELLNAFTTNEITPFASKLFMNIFVACGKRPLPNQSVEKILSKLVDDRHIEARGLFSADDLTHIQSGKFYHLLSSISRVKLMRLCLMNALCESSSIQSLLSSWKDPLALRRFVPSGIDSFNRYVWVLTDQQASIRVWRSSGPVNFDLNKSTCSVIEPVLDYWTVPAVRKLIEEEEIRLEILKTNSTENSMKNETEMIKDEKLNDSIQNDIKIGMENPEESFLPKKEVKSENEQLQTITKTTIIDNIDNTINQPFSPIWIQHASLLGSVHPPEELLSLLDTVCTAIDRAVSAKRRTLKKLVALLETAEQTLRQKLMLEERALAEGWTVSSTGRLVKKKTPSRMFANAFALGSDEDEDESDVEYDSEGYTVKKKTSFGRHGRPGREQLESGRRNVVDLDEGDEEGGGGVEPRRKAFGLESTIVTSRRFKREQDEELGRKEAVIKSMRDEEVYVDDLRNKVKNIEDEIPCEYILAEEAVKTIRQIQLQKLELQRKREMEAERLRQEVLDQERKERLRLEREKKIQQQHANRQRQQYQQQQQQQYQQYSYLSSPYPSSGHFPFQQHQLHPYHFSAPALPIRPSPVTSRQARMMENGSSAVPTAPMPSVSANPRVVAAANRLGSCAPPLNPPLDMLSYASMQQQQQQQLLSSFMMMQRHQQFEIPSLNPTTSMQPTFQNQLLFPSNRFNSNATIHQKSNNDLNAAMNPFMFPPSFQQQQQQGIPSIPYPQLFENHQQQKHNPFAPTSMPLSHSSQPDLTCSENVSNNSNNINNNNGVNDGVERN